MSSAELVDAAATQPVLVFGSLPPDARDLDLLVREPAEIEAVLRSAGYVKRGSYEWARFAGGETEPVDVSGDWPQLDELLEDALPLMGYQRLVRPSPTHQLLLLAHMLRGQGKYTTGRVARMRAALAEDPGAATTARSLAPRWGVAAELDRVLGGTPVDRRPRPRRPRIVAFSGIDGSGKSTQARALASSLGRLGYDVELAWAPLGSSKLLRAIFLPIRNALGHLRGLHAEARDDSGLVPNAGSVLREKSPLAHGAWSTLIALTNGLFHARTIARASASGRVVIFDRYVLDSLVRLRFLYGRERSYRAQDAIVRLLSPAPLGSFFLDVDARESLTRKDDRWTERDLDTLVELYRTIDVAGITRLDGTRPPEELAAEIAQAVWLRLD